VKKVQLNLTQLLHFIKGMPVYRQLLEELKQQNGSTVATVLNASKSYLIAALYHDLRLPMLVITTEPENSKKLQEQISAWCGSTQIRLLPEPDILPCQRAISDTETALARIQVLSALAGNESIAEPAVTIVSAPALMRKVASYKDFASAWHEIKLGMKIEPLHLLSQWQAIGYRMESLVELPGQVSHRGGILDIYPATGELPARLEFFGNSIDSIHLFDPESQRSLEAVSAIDIGPTTELLALLGANRSELESLLSNVDLTNLRDDVRQEFQQELTMLLDKQLPIGWQFYAPLFNHDSILSYLPRDALLILDEPESIQRLIDSLHVEANQLSREKSGRGELPRNFPRPYFSWEELKARIEKHQCLTFTAWGNAQEESHRFNFVSCPSYIGQLPAFVRKAKQLLKEKHRFIIVSHQASRLSELLAEEDIVTSPVTEIRQVPPLGSLTLVQGLLASGWVMNGDSHLVTDTEIFGFTKQQRPTKKHPVPRRKLFIDITPGDYVVHVEHGIARLAGVTTMSSNHTVKEYLVLEYTAGDRLYVPTDQIDRLSRYVGAGDGLPVLSRLGTGEWMRIKQRASEAAASIGRELLALYAAREVVAGFAFSSDTVWQQELEASFPYVETPDQLMAQKQVKEDMAKVKPMDRLILGDVGYGKTEVAIRAAFKAIMDAKQVAVLVPTTVLAEQHFFTFSQRLGAFPIKIEALSRLRSPKEQRAILSGLAGGAVDICIGTHRLLQKDVVFKDLGLLIIDEEQRFGVSHKEYLKKMRREVDVLTLSATPIPRTLHMSLVTVRDMSLMETPPEERLAIKTYVAPYDEQLVKEAMLREFERNGQVFFVHNRVKSIGYVADKLQALVPEARVAIAHGQMPEGELEAVMAEFTQGKINLLVCTVIIDAGLDVPNANTLIVNQADKLGLTQLYQLRGRVGRGTNLAHAYFLYDAGKRLNPGAEKRLRIIFEATELGAGFDIALRDLEIRGAGALLGVKQSGHISAVGFNLYTRLLAEAVEEQKARLSGTPMEKVKHLPPPTIDLPLTAYIPEEYVSDVNSRLSLYRNLANLGRADQITDLAREFKDRFGVLPKEVKDLLYVVKIKLLATRVGIESIFTEEGQVVLRLFEGIRFDKEKLEPTLRDGMKLGLTQLRLDLKHLGKVWQKILEEVIKRMG
jgi:transcription-repair coupling factor (superfamily II helicase)